MVEKVDLVKSQKTPVFVIPAKAEIQYFKIVQMLMDPGFHRGDDFLRAYQEKVKSWPPGNDFSDAFRLEAPPKAFPSQAL